MRTLVWFRGKDLRLADHAPLRRALEGDETIPLFVLDPHFFAAERAQQLPHRMQFMLDSLAELAASIERRGSRLVLVTGRSVEVVPALAKRWKVDRVVGHRWTEPFGRQRDAKIEAALDVPFELHEGETLVPPGTVRTGAGTPYAVYTPFRRALQSSLSLAAPLPQPRRLPALPADISVTEARLPTLESLGITRNPRVLPGGVSAARKRLSAFLRGPASGYDTRRDRMDDAGTSRLSVDLKFGTLSIRSVYAAVSEAMTPGDARDTFLAELVWREFSYATLWDRPEILNAPFRRDFEGFPWREDPVGLAAWAEGRTGYPVVDAAARQLLGEGFVHNRARMIAASFLTKHLMIDWRRGAAHYMRWLTDGDWASNTAGWQWSAGCGCDAQPYFRVFNPMLQGKRFDPEGDYVRRWVPELADVPTRFIHAPWTAPNPPPGYPGPVVEHAAARSRFLSIAKQRLQKAS